MSRRDGNVARTLLTQLVDENDLSNPQVRSLVDLAVHASNETLRKQALAAVTNLLIQRRTHPYASRDGSDLPTSGSLLLGTSLQGSPCMIEEEDLAKHMLTVGQSGSGKTTLIYTLLSQIDVPYWAFDLKQDYRHLINEDPELLVLPWTELEFNPLAPPPGVPPRRWAQVFSEMFGHATSLLSGSKNYLLKSVIELYRFYGLFDECSPPYPSLHELEAVLASDKISYVRKKANYRDTVLNRVEAMNLGAGTIFDCSEGFDLETLLQRDVIFEFDGLNRDIQNFVMEILLAAVYEYRLAQTHRDTGLNHLFVLDEGKQVFSVYKERQEAAGIPSIDDLTAKLREFGEGLLVADQEVSKLTDSIKANTYTKALLPTGDRKQFDAMAGSMHLTDRQESVAQELATGEAILQTGNDDPVRVSLHEYQIKKEVTDSDLRQRQGGRWQQLSSTPRQRPPGFEDYHGSNPHSTDDIVSDPDQALSLSREAKQLLEDVVEYPFVPLTQRYDQFSSHHVGYDAKQELTDTGIVTEHMLQAGSISRKLLDLTERGRSFVEDNLEIDPSSKGRGGVVHRFWQHQVKTAFDEADWTTKLELFDADVYATNSQVELGVEIAMEDTEREVEHIKDRLETGFDAVWVVCRNSQVRAGIETRVADADLDTSRIIFRTVSEFEEPENVSIPE